jgi:hypothetical protein
MMHGCEKSRPVIVAMKPANKAARSATEPSVKEPAAAESAEPRAGAKGNADWQSTRRTQSRVSVSQALERIRQVGSRLLCRSYPRWEPHAGKPQVSRLAVSVVNVAADSAATCAGAIRPHTLGRCGCFRGERAGGFRRHVMAHRSFAAGAHCAD